jgi:hypothetical protein
VPDLPAKGMIDLQLTVDSLAWVDDAAFGRQGFKRIPGLMDHSPPVWTCQNSNYRNVSLGAWAEASIFMFVRKSTSASVICFSVEITCALTQQLLAHTHR